MSINERIRQVLKEGQVSQKSLADALGISEGRLSQKFKAGIWDSIEEIKVVSSLCQCRLDWLITGKGIKLLVKEEDFLIVHEDGVKYNTPMLEKIMSENKEMRSALLEINKIIYKLNLKPE
jgi:transcriptional regulator with XRE-family HTH domain